MYGLSAKWSAIVLAVALGPHLRHGLIRDVLNIADSDAEHWKATIDSRFMSLFGTLAAY